MGVTTARAGAPPATTRRVGPRAHAPLATRGSRPSQFLRVVAAFMLLQCSLSARASLAALVTAATAWLAPRGPLLRLRAAVLSLAEPSAAPPPAVFEPSSPDVHDAKHARRKHRQFCTWRPPTPNGKYLSPRQFAEQGEASTADGLGELFKSPAYQRWLQENHHRLNVGGAAAAPTSPGDE